MFERANSRGLKERYGTAIGTTFSCHHDGDLPEPGSDETVTQEEHAHLPHDGNEHEAPFRTFIHLHLPWLP